MVSLAMLSSWDAATCRQINGINRRRGWRLAFAIASRLGDGIAWYGLMLALPAVCGRSGLAESLLLALNGACCTLVYRWIKGMTRRPRPSQVYASLTLTVAPLDRFSFPSGHTLHAVAFTVLASWLHPALLWPLAAFTTLVALSRMVLGLHYPSDVAAGAAIGAGFSALAILVAPVLGIGVGVGS